MVENIWHQHMREGPHLAPCPRRNLNWVYRGQACVDCEDRPECRAWAPIEGVVFSTEVPPNIPIPKLKK